MKHINAGIFFVMVIGLVTTSLCSASSAWATLLNPSIPTVNITAATSLAQLSSSNLQHQIKTWKSDKAAPLNHKIQSQPHNSPDTLADRFQIDSNAKTDLNSTLDMAWRTASLVAIDSSTSLPENIIASRFDVTATERQTVEVQSPLNQSTPETGDTTDNKPPGTLIFLGLGLIGLGLARRADRHK
ncbi:MAG TPA: hypothetical protein VN030_11915 [Cellvibrio sp.]|nr:hypothetical protein [Cellvibrio sp.]